jgi:hypothetical protein
MGTIALAAVSDRWPVGTSVGAWPAGTIPAGSDGPPQTNDAAIVSAAVAADGSLTLTNAGLLADTPYVCYALNAASQPRSIRTRIASFDRAQGVASAVTSTSGSKTLTSVTLTSGRVEIGARITAVGVPSGTTVVDIPTTTSVTMSNPATASGTVAATFDGSLAWGAIRDARKQQAGCAHERDGQGRAGGRVRHRRTGGHPSAMTDQAEQGYPDLHIEGDPGLVDAIIAGHAVADPLIAELARAHEGTSRRLDQLEADRDAWRERLMAVVEAKRQEDNEWRTVLLAELRRIAQALERR